MSKNIIIAVIAGFAAGILVMLLKDTATCRQPAAEKTQIAAKSEKTDNLLENKQLTKPAEPRPRRQTRKRLMREDFAPWFAELKEAHLANDVKRVDELLAEMDQYRRQLQELRQAVLERRRQTGEQEGTRKGTRKGTVTGP